MILHRLRTNRRLLIAGGGILTLLLVLVFGIVALRYFYPSTILPVLHQLNLASGQIQEQSFTGLALDLEVHSGEYSREEQTTYFPFHDEASSIEVAATLGIRSDSEEREVYTLAVLMDYEQIPLTVTHTSLPIYRIEAEPYEPMDLDFSISIPNQAGRRQLFLVLFQEIEMSDADAYYRGLETVHITDIVIGDDVTPDIVYEEVPNTFELDPEDNVGGPHLNQDASDHRQPWFSATVTSDEAISYAIHLGNNSLPAHPYALIVWLDKHQIPLGAGKSPAFFGYIEDDERQVIPAEIKIPPDNLGSPGDIHELQLLYITYPYYPITRRAEGMPEPHFEFTRRTALLVGE
ncbi:MAG: hypothetical protein GVY30_00275 [Chloroflexi bacterium]|jgi:hypothetical protein|nr:hypothetical protein [Chloroflexota bacterium]